MAEQQSPTLNTILTPEGNVRGDQANFASTFQPENRYAPLNQEQIQADDLAANEKQLDDVDVLSGKFYKTFIANAGKDNLVANAGSAIINKLYYNDDPNYETNDETIFNLMQQEEIEAKYFGTLRGAKSGTELQGMLLSVKRDQQTERDIAQTLSSKARITSSIVGAVGDADVLLGFGVAALTSKSTSIAKIAAIEGAGEALLAVSRLATNDDYTASDAMFDSLLGTGIAVGATTFLRSSKKASVEVQKVSDTTDITEPFGLKIDTESSANRSAFFAKQEELSGAHRVVGSPEYIARRELDVLHRGETYRRLGFNEDEIAEQLGKDFSGDFATDITDTFRGQIKDAGHKQAQLQKNIDDFDESFKDIDPADIPKEATAQRKKWLTEQKANNKARSKLIKSETKAMEIEADLKMKTDRKNIERAEERRVNQEIADKFKDPQYEPYKANRRAFFKQQDEFGTPEFKGRIDELQTSVKNIVKDLRVHKKELDKLKKDPKAKKSSIDYRERRVRELSKQQEVNTKTLDNLENPSSISPVHARLLNVLDEAVPDMEIAVKELRQSVKRVSNQDAKELLDAVKGLGDSVPEAKELLDILKSKALNKEFSPRTIKEILGKNLNGRQKLAVVGAVMLAGSQLQAADGGDSDNSGLILAALAAIIGVKLYGKDITVALKNKGLQESVRNFKASVESSIEVAYTKTSPEANAVRRVASTISDLIHTRITSTMAPFQKAGGEYLDIAEKLMFSIKGGSGAENIKQSWSHATLNKYNMSEKRNFKAWQQERKNAGNPNVSKDINDEAVFRQEVSDALEFGTSKSPAVKTMAKEVAPLFEENYLRAKNYGVFGFENFKFKPNMLPRLWKNDNLRGLINKLSKEDFGKVKTALSDAIELKNGNRALAEKQADTLMEYWGKNFSKNGGNDAVDDIFSSLKGLFKDGTEFDEFVDAMRVSGDKNARAKARIDIDMEAFAKNLEDVEFIIDGQTRKLGLNDFVERDIKVILDRTSNTLNASSAFARHGNWKSTADLDRAIAKAEAGTPTKEGVELAKELRDVRDMILGVPIKHDNTKMHEISMIIKDITIITKLPLVLFSLPYEAILTMANGGFVRGMRNSFVAIQHTMGKESELIRQLSEHTGQGSALNRIDTSGYRGVTDNLEDVTDMGALSKLRRETMRVRDMSLVLNGLIPVTDIFQRANLATNAEVFAKYVDNLEDLVGPRAKAFGIDDDTLAMFKDTFEYTEQGALKKINMKGWSQSKRDKFTEVLFDMGQNQSLQSTIGESPLYGKNSAVGRMITTLIGYPMEQFNIHGVGALNHLDRTAALQTTAAFMGSYVGLKARYAVLDKDVEEETILAYALMNSPLLGALTGMKSMTDPVSFNVANDMVKMMGVR